MRCAECGREAVNPVPCDFGYMCRLCHEKIQDRDLREDLRRKDLKRGENWLGITDKHKHGSATEIKRKRGRH